ncbi:MAG TPA: hypothetical protein VFQ54_02950, partial [Thermomicrobiales bacterium]|nr:hypothetical protein [Thermomicrobiales bacterium]
MILTVNAGSSSLKVGLFHGEGSDRSEISSTIERLDSRGGRWTFVSGHEQGEGSRVHSTHDDALVELLEWLDARGYRDRIEAAGHRVVHGWITHVEPTVVDEALLGDLERLIPMDPGHLPQAIACMRILTRSLPELPQIACFDTAFHHTMPRVARM